MGLAAKLKLGRYEVQCLLGAGGMGEVYKARDTKLDRTVALKVLPEDVASDADRLSRFEHEARMLSALNHPNLLAIYDVGTQNGIQYLVSEFLQGHTLRELLHDAPLGVRKATEYAVEITKGLVAAHERGIVHRDLKPENIFVTEDGRVKILDFGLAKLSLIASHAASEMTLTVKTDPGVVLGTIGYMSPEQVRRQEADARSDLFALGAILYEMVSGVRAFGRATAADTMSAILKEDPPPLTDSGHQIPPGLECIIAHCLEKDPHRRFQTAQDFSFNLEQLSHLTRTSAPPVPGSLARLKSRPWPVLVVLGLLIGVGAAFIAGRYSLAPAHRSFHQLTFQRGRVLQARFSPDGQTIVYGAAWNGEPSEVYSTRADRAGARSLELKGAQVLAVSSAGDLAVLTKVYAAKGFVDTGTLAILPLSGGALREVADRIQYADFSPDGTKLAVIRDLGPRERLEYPIGRPLFEFTGWLSHARMSPSGDQIAFVEHPSPNDTNGSLVVIDTSRNEKILVKDFSEILDLAWSPTSDEIWFTASEKNAQRSLYAVDKKGNRRLLLEVPGNIVLKDVSRDGRVLLVRDSPRRELSGIVGNNSKVRDFSWFDWTLVDDVARDGSTFTFHEAGVGGGKEYAQFLRSIDSSAPVLLGPGDGGIFSPDGKWVLSASAGSPSQLVLYSVGAGETRNVTHDSINYLDLAWLPDSNRFVAVGAEPGHSTRLYLEDVAGTPPKPISAEGYAGYGVPISPDGRYFVASCLDLKPCLIPLDGSKPRPIPNTDVTDNPVQWTDDGRSLYIYHLHALPAPIELLDIVTGQRRPWKTIAPADPAGVHGMDQIRMTRDGRVCLYSYLRTFSELYLVEGIR